MTIALTIQVNDGLVMAADSATIMQFANKQELVYNNANKLINLYKGLPLGLVTYGLGNIGGFSIATLAKDFRQLISDKESTHKIDPDTYTVEEVATKFFNFIYTERYLPESKTWPTKHLLGFTIAGYSAKSSSPEQWTISIDNNGACAGPQQVASQGDVGALWNGITEPLSRLFNGLSQDVESVMNMAGIDNTKAQDFLKLSRNHLAAPFITPLMPVQDAIDIAGFMVHLTTQYVRFSPGHNVVGGPMEIATITKHEGFKWIQRKLYFDSSINDNYKYIEPREAGRHDV